MRLPVQLGLILLSIATATISEAQVAPVSRQVSPHQFNGNPGVSKPSATIPATPANVSSAPEPSSSSLLDEPPSPAQVHVDGGKLSVKAENSTLSGILHEISSETGMTVDGLSKDQRIFGNYGPAAPREVLSALLDGLGYNVLMVGDQSNGAPRQLLLTQRTAGSAGGNHGVQQPIRQSNSTSSDDDDDSNSTPDNQDNVPVPPRPVPAQPEVNQDQQPATPPQGQGQVKTPQQMLQELQQMRQQQQQQQLQQQQSGPQQ